MMKITVVALRKGGVGKTTTAQHVGYALASFGRKVLLLDLDPQASLTNLFGVSGAGGTLAGLFDEDGNAEIKKLREIIVPTYQENLDLAPASDDLARADLRISRNPAGAYAIYDLLKGQRLPYDHVIIDTAPGRSALLQAALVAADGIVIPVQLSPMGFHGFGAIDEMIVEARRSQSRMPEGVRLSIRAVVPTFYSQNQIISDAFLSALTEAEHLDYENYRLPIAPPIPETTAFEKASAPMEFDGAQRARTIFEMDFTGDDSPTERGQDAYLVLAQMIASREPMELSHV